MSNEDRKRPVLIGRIVLAALLAAGLAYGCLWLFYWSRYASTDDAIIDGNKAAISAKAMARIKLLAVDEHDTVAAGQLLVQLDDTDLKAQREQAAASLTLARHNLALAQVNAERAANDLQRARTQYDVAAITAEGLDHAQKSDAAARAQLAIAQAQIGIAQAQLDVIAAQLQNMTLTAPFSGVITRRTALAGEVVQPGQAIFSLYDLRGIWVTANFEETQVGAIRPDQAVSISVDAYPGRTLRGHVDQIAANIVPPPFTIGEFTKTTQRVSVKILLDERPASMLLLLGMSVEVKVKIK